MPRISGSALRSAHGDLHNTLLALDRGTGDPASLPGDFVGTLLETAREALAGTIPDLVIIATTKGDLPQWRTDLRAVIPCGAGGPVWLATQIGQAMGCQGFAVSGACASGPLALGVAARGILAGRWQRVVVIGADRIDAFISEGFTALRAIDPQHCRPFDAQRAGLRLGELVAAVVLEPATTGIGPFLQGWAAGMDANHLTGPTRDGSGLARTLRSALQRADVATPALVIAHGTGTRYNDDSESLAYAAVCPGTPVTAFKGLLGHSLGACGVAELALAIPIYQRGCTPGCANLQQPGSAGAISLLKPGTHPLASGALLLANAGFGGINGALVLGAVPAIAPHAVTPHRVASAHLSARGWQRTRADGVVEDCSWSEPGEGDALPRLSARCVLGRVEATWGRMDLPCRALVTLGHLLGPLPADSAIVLVTARGSAASDRLHDQAVLAGAVDPQRFPYTLPTTPIGEASIRLGIRGPGLSVHGATDAEVRELAHDLLADGIPGVLIAWIEADLAPHTARAEWWSA
jgi:Beta-ketoacyl synthase, C-terminal domain/Beta-ketoacyl synthase, N-terminal domain